MRFSSPSSRSVPIKGYLIISFRSSLVTRPSVFFWIAERLDSTGQEIFCYVQVNSSFQVTAFYFRSRRYHRKLLRDLRKRRMVFENKRLYFPKPPHHTNSFYFLMSINLLMIMLIMPICVYYVQRNIPVIPENVNIGHLILPRVLKFVRPAAHA